MENTSAYRKELADFLRGRRERLTPEEAGIDTLGDHRRTPGLRRSEVADRAGVSVTWYTWLEQARRIRVSPQVLNSLARALLLSRTETEHLFELAGEFAPAQPEHIEETEAAAHLDVVYRQLLSRLSPLPALIVTKCWDIVQANDAFGQLLPFGAGSPGIPPNLLALMFEPEARKLFVDWSREAAESVARFRASVGRDIVHPDVAGLVEWLAHSRAEFRALWRQRLVAADPLTVHRLSHPVLGRRDMVGTSMALVGSDRTLIVYVPVAAVATADGERFRHLRPAPGAVLDEMSGLDGFGYGAETKVGPLEPALV